MVLLLLLLLVTSIIIIITATITSIVMHVLFFFKAFLGGSYPRINSFESTGACEWKSVAHISRLAEWCVRTALMVGVIWVTQLQVAGWLLNSCWLTLRTAVGRLVCHTRYYSLLAAALAPDQAFPNLTIQNLERSRKATLWQLQGVKSNLLTASWLAFLRWPAEPQIPQQVPVEMAQIGDNIFSYLDVTEVSVPHKLSWRRWRRKRHVSTFIYVRNLSGQAVRYSWAIGRVRSQGHSLLQHYSEQREGWGTRVLWKLAVSLVQVPPNPSHTCCTLLQNEMYQYIQ